MSVEDFGASACSDNCRFSSHDEYMEWCEAMVTKIYYAQIAMRNDLICEVVSEIGSKLWLQEGVELFPYPNIASEGQPGGRP
jgi:hypothetical protein